MKKKDIKGILSTQIEETPDVFHQSILHALDEVQDTQPAPSVRVSPLKPKRPVLLFVLLLLLLCALASAAVLTSNLFKNTLGIEHVKDSDFVFVTHQQKEIDGVTLTLKEAAYDGMTLFVHYSIKDHNSTIPLGEYDNDAEQYVLTSEAYDSIFTMPVRWWADSIWVDGVERDMPVASQNQMLSENKEEIEWFDFYSLSDSDILPQGDTIHFDFPVGSPDKTRSKEDRFLSFTLDATIQDRIQKITPNICTTTPLWHAKVTEVIFSPVQMYVNLSWGLQEGVLEKFIEKNGIGEYDENGTLLWTYDAMDAMPDNFMYHLWLVDEKGRRIGGNEKGYFGMSWCGQDKAQFTFPYLEEYPQKLYLAVPSQDGRLDREHAIVIRE